MGSGDTPQKNLLDAAIKRSLRGGKHVPKRVETKTASIMEVSNNSNSETGSGQPSANETL